VRASTSKAGKDEKYERWSSVRTRGGAVYELRAMETYKKTTFSNMLASFQIDINLTYFKTFTPEYFYENFIKPVSEKNIFVVKNTNKTK